MSIVIESAPRLMATARTIISLALESMNKLSPGETLDADLAASCLRRLNSIADDWSAGRDLAPQEAIVSGAVTGVSLTLGAGSFAAVGPGDEIMGMTADNLPMAPITMAQYQTIYLKTQTGRPLYWAADGLSNVFLYPAAAGHTMGLLVRTPFTQFADLDTAYTMPSGYQGAFSAALAVAMAPALVGKVTQDLKDNKREALANIRSGNVRPAIISANPTQRAPAGGILQGWR